MANVYLKDSTLTSIGDAIRSKNGTTIKYKPSEMSAAIKALSVGGGGLDFSKMTHYSFDITNLSNDAPSDKSGYITLDRIGGDASKIALIFWHLGTSKEQTRYDIYKGNSCTQVYVKGVTPMLQNVDTSVLHYGASDSTVLMTLQDNLSHYDYPQLLTASSPLQSSYTYSCIVIGYMNRIVQATWDGNRKQWDGIGNYSWYENRVSLQVWVMP